MTHSASPSSREWATHARTDTDGSPSRAGNSSVSRSPGPNAQRTISLTPPDEMSKMHAARDASSSPATGVTCVSILT